MLTGCRITLSPSFNSSKVQLEQYQNDEWRNRMITFNSSKVQLEQQIAAVAVC